MPRVRSTTTASHALLLIALAFALSAAIGSTASAKAPLAGQPDFGPNVTVFDPSMPVGEIQARIDAIHASQVDNEMGTERYALLFKPGVYGTSMQPLQLKVGYYTEVAGLGASPTDVTINGKIEVYNRCLAPDNCIALVNFWRTLSNLSLSINAAGQDGCRASANFWAVSQAVSMRRLDIGGGNLSLMDYCTAGPQFASGGFIADSNLPFVINGSQQQWLIRNSRIGGWSNAVWNQVFAGVEGAPEDASLPESAVHDARDDARQPREAVPLRRRAGRLQRPRARRADEHARHHVGRRHDGGSHDPAPRLLRREAVGLGADDQQPARPRHESAAHPRCLRRRGRASR